MTVDPDQDPAGAGEGRIENVTGVLLVPSRHGDGLIALAVKRLAGVLADLFEEVLIVGADPPGNTRARRVTPGSGPANGLRDLSAALDVATSPRVCAVSSDFPLLSPDVLLMLVAYPEADAVAPRVLGRDQPLCAIYAREPASSAARARLREGASDPADLLAGLALQRGDPADLETVDPGARSFERLATPDAVAHLESLLASDAGDSAG